MLKLTIIENGETKVVEVVEGARLGLLANTYGVGTQLVSAVPAEKDLKLVRGSNFGYGEYQCSCGCGKKLIGRYAIVSEESDEEGYEWRGFDPKCWVEIGLTTDAEIYAKYPAAPAVDEEAGETK